ncbi:sodium:solute symporter [Williamwhitmania taraxaci]|uniref:Transporter, SSS family n=1 Tax=Williamwhitmania taraxaci TaxID=1640674 RepID=A0A1G6GRV1_9BACT|nr:sodium:solute symporter [Williamwhitmania taraxaci]SDB84762.1 transporter, SSS family [Williamwhitmania taraxaci]
MSPLLVSFIIVFYFVVLVGISYLTTRKVDSKSFFGGTRKSPWYIIAIGMIGTSISGVTFISVPGAVYTEQFSYLQMVLGFLVGYLVVANVLLPLYYRLNLTSIYSYLESRFGFFSYKTGALFFLLSRSIGSAFRLYIVAIVLQTVIFDKVGVPFWVSVSVTIGLIYLYTYKGGVKTIIWTDLVQTFAMLTAVVLCLVLVSNAMGFSFGQMVDAVHNSKYSRVWFFDDPMSKLYFWKQFLAGVFIPIVMTGLDQDQMQKNLSCRSLSDAKKNMYWYSLMFVPINLIFMSMGVLLVLYAQRIGLDIPAKTDKLFPLIATGGYLHATLGVTFVVGVIAAAYSSADSALTALTTSFTVDILGAGKYDETRLKRIRTMVHLGMSLLLIAIILLFKAINNEAVIKAIYTVAGYTYGPLLGLYAFGVLTKRRVRDYLVPVAAVLAPILCFGATYLFAIGFELLIYNGVVTFVLIWLTGIGLKVSNK